MEFGPLDPAEVRTSDGRPVALSHPGAKLAGMYILDCSDCVGRETEACDDCLVRHVVERGAVLDDDDVRAIAVLADAGLVPEPRHLRAVS